MMILLNKKVYSNNVVVATLFLETMYKNPP